ncbi:MAG TPA: Imm27 family immunity protein [Polyangiaceae bacterium]|nr:Imm27 family immunity protein [Polyangiaceae bacterium]
MDKLRPDEERLIGTWESQQGQLKADDVAQRIDFLVASVLQRVASSPDGWSVLYRDPDDGRLWELTYPQSETHGGGAPELRQISPSDAEEKYGVNR